MSTQRSALLSRQADLTQRLILDAGISLLESGQVADLSVRAVARRAEVSERTVFRYFATRDDLLDALAAEVSSRLQTPPPPQTVEQLLAYPAAIYARFEESSALAQAALHSELVHRIRRTDAGKRYAAIRAILDREAPGRTERERRLTAANIQYYVVASTWRYYRFYFGFPVEDAVECARLAIGHALAGLGIEARAAVAG